MINTGGGLFDKSEQNIYFIAAGVHDIGLLLKSHTHFLVAVNEISDSHQHFIDDWIGKGIPIFLDSGVYNLAMQHAKKHDVSHNVALATPIYQLDGFQDLYDKYIRIVSQYKDGLWGYIEIDLGGREQKIQTRDTLHENGLNPIPVYHPLSDGWDYFDYLATRYDRICIGNIVQAPMQVRKRILATLWERHKTYPDLWMHLLGYTPNQHLYAYPFNSADSSTWSNVVRWSGFTPRVALKSFGRMDKNFQYELGGDEITEAYNLSKRMGAFGSFVNMRNWQAHIKRLEALGFGAYKDD